MYGDTAQDQEDNTYLYNGKHTFVSEVPEYIDDDVAESTQQQDNAAVDHVAAVLATLSKKKKGLEEERIIL